MACRQTAPPFSALFSGGSPAAGSRPRGLEEDAAPLESADGDEDLQAPEERRAPREELRHAGSEAEQVPPRHLHLRLGEEVGDHLGRVVPSGVLEVEEHHPAGSAAFTPQTLEQRQSLSSTTLARVDQAKSQLASAENNLAYTDLRSDAPGVVTAVQALG